MNRRHFLGCAAMACPFLTFPRQAKQMRMGVIVHSYGHRWHSKVESIAFPPFYNALDLMEHCHAIGAGGLQVMVNGWSQTFAHQVRDRREALDLYLEGSVALPSAASDADRFEKEVLAAKEAGADVLRTVCLSGRRYETFDSLDAFNVFRTKSLASLEQAEPIVRKHRMRLAIENHKDWRADEFVSILRHIDSEWVGVNLDFGNNVALMEEPLTVARVLAPWVMTTHVKDMGAEEYEDGFLLSEVPLGQGFLDLGGIFDICRSANARVRFNLEMITRDPLKIPCLTKGYWATFTGVSPEDLAATLRRVREQRFRPALPRVSHLSPLEKLAVEERNVLASLAHSRKELGLDWTESSYSKPISQK